MTLPNPGPAHKTPQQWFRELPGNLWKKLLDHLTGIVFGALLTVATTTVLYLNDLIFDPATSRTVTQQDQFGMYCLNTFFKSARKDGAELNFQPLRLENTGICGQPPKTDKQKDRDALATVFGGQLNRCMVATPNNETDHGWDIVERTDAGNRISSLTVDDTVPFFACNCTDAQLALLALEKKGRPWCGNDALPAENVRPELRNYLIKW
jgi:hypothetical protein